ncbi:glycoside hydrolase family 3 N-terminal domain-containing protein [Pelagibacteraceae bacterium]|jgi:beta-N-acetylhexosaminidase|nr:glycoside hydrolase family 3 N-terminal domain-containing protein [Pelagibacteraceae bacterium]
MKKKAIIVSIKGLKLTKKERLLLLNENPWGLILFKRNIKSLSQVKLLIINIRNLTKDKNFPILIDEEGGTVSRLINLINHKFTAKFFGTLYLNNKKLCLTLYKKYLDSLCKILKDIGLNINTIPVLDVLRSNTSSVISDRSFSKNPNIVKLLGQITVKHCHKNRIICVIKHIPGHGCAISDSHYEMPKVNISITELKKIDFYPFKNSSAKMAMTAHILYKRIDSKNVATFSNKIISKTIRKKIGFNGILISDDISMKALKYDLVTNAKKSIEAGCNLVLYCAGNINDNFKLIKSVPFIDKFTVKKTSEIYKILR